jgi:hypothetical protein
MVLAYSNIGGLQKITGYVKAMPKRQNRVGLHRKRQ